MKLLVVYIVALFPLQLVAQNTLDSRATVLCQKGYHAEALEMFEKCLQNETASDSTIIKLTNCYLHVNKFLEAKQITEVWENSREMSDSLKLLCVYVSLLLQEYKKAEVLLGDLVAAERIDSATNLQYRQWKLWQHYNSMLSTHKAVNLKEINTEYSDFAPVLFSQALVFCSTRENILIKRKSKVNGEPFSDLYLTTQINDSIFNTPRPFSKYINTAAHEGSPSFNKNFDTIYFSRNGENKRNYQSKLFSASIKNKEWDEPVNFMLNDSSGSFAQPYLTKDGLVFFFASNMVGGMGGSDLYFCIKKDSNWSLPINLGSTINTSGNETYPFFSTNGTLYFASDTHFGLGGIDIFSSEQKSGNWSPPKNMGIPYNSAGDDFGLTIYNEKDEEGYITSDRTNGVGGNDIYLIKKK